LENKLKLSPWEINALKTLSVEYTSQFNGSGVEGVNAPYTNPNFDREVVSNNVSSFFRNLMAGNKERSKK